MGIERGERERKREYKVEGKSQSGTERGRDEVKREREKTFNFRMQMIPTALCCTVPRPLFFFNYAN